MSKAKLGKTTMLSNEDIFQTGRNKRMKSKKERRRDGRGRKGGGETKKEIHDCLSQRQMTERDRCLGMEIILEKSHKIKKKRREREGEKSCKL